MSFLAVAMMTHTTRHLRRSLMGLAYQSRRADCIVVSCDNDLAEIAELLRRCSDEFGLRLVHVARPKQNEPRMSQVRNNAARTLLASNIPSHARVVFFDGDCCPAPDTLRVHELHGSKAGLVVGFRFDLTPEQTTAFDEDAMKHGRAPAEIPAAAHAALRSRDARYRRQLFLKRFGLTKAHKPKVLSANFSVALPLLTAINGFDEEFVGYGAEDDDFSRRAYRAGGRASIAVRDAVVYHQWHETRAPQDWERAPGVKRFKLALPARCIRGIENEIEQPPPQVVVFERGRELDRFAMSTTGTHNALGERLDLLP